MNAGRTWALRIGLIAATASLAACSLGDVGDGGGGNGDDPERIPSDDPAVDDRLDALEIICETTLTVSGTFEEGRPQPADMSGCWEVGVWTVNWDIDFQGCDPQPEFAQTFTYNIDREGDDNEESAVYWQDDPDNERVNLKVSTDSSARCLGSFEHFGDNGDNRIVIVLQPVLEEDNTFTGIGSWSLYQEDPF